MTTTSPVPYGETLNSLEQLVSAASGLDAALDGSTSEYHAEHQLLDAALKRASAALRRAGNTP